MGDVDNLLYYHLLAAFLHTISTALSFSHDSEHFKTRNIYARGYEYNVTDTAVTTSSKDVNLGEKQNFMTWLSVNELLTALSHALAVLVLVNKRSQFKYMETQFNDEDYRGIHVIELLRRTLEYCATAAIIQVAFVLSAADMTLTDIIFIFILNVGTQLVGYIIDDRKDMVSDGLNFLVGFLLLAGQLIYVYMLSTQVQFSKTLEEDKFFITFASIFFVIFYVSFGLLKLLCYVHNIKKVIEDQLYVVLSVSAKLSLTWILIGNIFTGYYRLCNSIKFGDSFGKNQECSDLSKNGFYGPSWQGVQITFIIIGGLGLLFCLIMGLDTKNNSVKKPIYPPDSRQRTESIENRGGLVQRTNRVEYTKLDNIIF